MPRVCENSSLVESNIGCMADAMHATRTRYPPRDKKEGRGLKAGRSYFFWTGRVSLRILPSPGGPPLGKLRIHISLNVGMGIPSRPFGSDQV